jgi:aspartate aminotransferase
MVALDSDTAAKTAPLLVQLSRAEITSCPSYGARIIAEILGDQTLYNQWLDDLVQMSSRMKTMRASLFQGLVHRRVRGSWKHLLSDVSFLTSIGRLRYINYGSRLACSP